MKRMNVMGMSAAIVAATIGSLGSLGSFMGEPSAIKRSKTGRLYPNSSKRQNDRFKAKWEAGKYDFTASGVTPPKQS